MEIERNSNKWLNQIKSGGYWGFEFFVRNEIGCYGNVTAIGRGVVNTAFVVNYLGVRLLF